MEHTKGNWDLTSKEFTERNTLGKITLLGLKESEIGSAISDLSKQYVIEKCKLSEGQQVRYIYYTNNWCYGIVSVIRFDIDEGFIYYIDKYIKNWERRFGYKTVRIKHNDLSNSIFKDSVKIESLLKELK